MYGHPYWAPIDISSVVSSMAYKDFDLDEIIRDIEIEFREQYDEYFSEHMIINFIDEYLEDQGIIHILKRQRVYINDMIRHQYDNQYDYIVYNVIEYLT